MTLVFGGIYQGKLDFVLSKYNLTNEDIYFCNANEAINLSKRILYNYEQFVLYQIRNNIDPLLWLKEHIPYLSEHIIIATDISSGIVPISEEERLLLSKLGASLNFITTNADEVYRLFCGIATKLK